MSEQVSVDVSSTRSLKRVLGFWDLLSLSLGQVVGSGIFLLVGVGIAMTGRSVNVSFLVSALFMLIYSVPLIFVSGTIRMRGGTYSQCALFVSKKFAGFFVITHLILLSATAMMAIGFVYYLASIVPGVIAYRKIIGLVFATVIFGVNFLGIKQAAITGKIMIVIMAAAMTLFIMFGISKVEPGYFSGPGFMTDGLAGMLTTAAILTFSTMGAADVINFGAEAKNPTKHIPLVIIVATILVAVFYAFVATIGAGVLPIEEVENQPLSIVAKLIMPSPLFYFFVIGGAMMGLLTTMNSLIGWGTKPLMQACDDGWFPKRWAEVNNRFRTPHWLLLGLYVIGIIPILADWNIEFIVNYSVIAMRIVGLTLCFTVIRLPDLIPAIWGKSKYNVSKKVLWIVAIVTSLVTVFQTLLLIKNLDVKGMIGTGSVIVIAIVFVQLRSKYVTIDMSYEEN